MQMSNISQSLFQVNSEIHNFTVMYIMNGLKLLSICHHFHYYYYMTITSNSLLVVDFYLANILISYKGEVQSS